MNNPNNNKSYHQQQESYIDSNGNTHIKRTSETVSNSTPSSNYQSGYVHGQATERSYQEQRLAQQDENSTSRGLVLGFLIALVGLVGGAVWYFSQNNTTSESATPAAAPVAPATNPTPVPTVTQPVEVQTHIIERTREVPVPVTKEVPVPVIVPQQAPEQNNTTPNVNITVPPPPQQTTTTPDSSTQTTAPKPSSNSNTENNSENSSTNTNQPASQDTNQAGTAPSNSPSTSGAN